MLHIIVFAEPKAKAAEDKRVQMLEDALAQLEPLKNELSSLEEQRKSVDAETPEAGKLDQRIDFLKREIGRKLSLIRKLETSVNSSGRSSE